jgi:zinc protease
MSILRRNVPALLGLLLVLLLCVSLSPAAWADGSTAAALQAADAPRSFTLANGMTLLVQPDHRAPTVVHMLWVRAGGIDDAPDAASRSGTGRAHLLEHLTVELLAKTELAGDISCGRTEADEDDDGE